MRLWFYLSSFGLGFFAALAVFLECLWGSLRKACKKRCIRGVKKKDEAQKTTLLKASEEAFKTEKLDLGENIEDEK
ncbi:MAG: hypothetical protein Q4C55_03960 [Eubacterium sp.]|nr:hypothetical protein [Eubacterium sp.]